MPSLVLPSSLSVGVRPTLPKLIRTFVLARGSVCKPSSGSIRTHLKMTSTKPFPVIKDHGWEKKAPYALVEGKKKEDYVALRGQCFCKRVEWGLACRAPLDSKFCQ